MNRSGLSVKRFEQSSWLHSALYNNIPLLFFYRSLHRYHYYYVTDVDGSLKETSDTNSVVDTMLRPNGTGDSLRGCSLLNLDRKESVGVMNNT